MAEEKTLDGTLSINISREGTRIRVRDKKSGTEFVEVVLTPEQLSMALSNLMDTPCVLKVRGLSKIGKLLQVDTLEFPIPKGVSFDSNKKIIVVRLAKEHCPEGWTPDTSFSSQGSFFTKTVKGKTTEWARTHIRRWIEL